MGPCSCLTSGTGAFALARCRKVLGGVPVLCWSQGFKWKVEPWSVSQRVGDTQLASLQCLLDVRQPLWLWKRWLTFDISSTQNICPSYIWIEEKKKGKISEVTAELLENVLTKSYLFLCESVFHDLFWFLGPPIYFCVLASSSVTSIAGRSEAAVTGRAGQSFWLQLRLMLIGCGAVVWLFTCPSLSPLVECVRKTTASARAPLAGLQARPRCWWWAGTWSPWRHCGEPAVTFICGAGGRSGLCPRHRMIGAGCKSKGKRLLPKYRRWLVARCLVCAAVASRVAIAAILFGWQMQ